MVGMQTGGYHLTERPSPLCVWAEQWAREADQTSKLPYQTTMPFPGRRKQQPQGMRGPNPPRWQNRVSALKWQQKELRRDTGKNFPTWYLGGSDGNSCGSGSSGAGGCPSGRLRLITHTLPPPTPRPGPGSQPGLSPALINLQGQGRGGGW